MSDVENLVEEETERAKQRVADDSLKRQLLEDVERAGGLKLVGKGKPVSFAVLLKKRSVYATVKKAKLENWLNYWRKLDDCAYSDLLAHYQVTAFAQLDLIDRLCETKTETMASQTGGPPGRRTTRNNNNARGVLFGPRPPPHTGTFVACTSCLLQIS
jgi:hypothetical protein